jgi:hypothetical protein
MNENLDNVQKQQQLHASEQKQNSTDDTGGFVFSSAVKISDPNTKEILVQVRGDY